MSFEKQICQKCKKLAYCVDIRSLDMKRPPLYEWLCENCYGYSIENAQTKDTIRSIMIQCGIEDLEARN